MYEVGGDMKRYFITFSYDGTNFSGFQVQPGERTVQGELERALKEINNQKDTKVCASGRTDRGVHAKGQTAHFDLSVTITEAKLKRALNSNLPDDIHVSSAQEVKGDFHARYHVKEKTYQYQINLGEYNPTERNYVHQCNHILNIEKIEQALTYFLGTHDFRAFVSENTLKENCVRTITEATIKKDPLDEYKYTITFTGTGFLKYQVRNMVGLLIKIGEEKRPPEDVRKVLESKDRTKASSTAPACGLTLLKVVYEDPFDKLGKK